MLISLSFNPNVEVGLPLNSPLLNHIPVVNEQSIGHSNPFQVVSEGLSSQYLEAMNHPAFKILKTADNFRLDDTHWKFRVFDHPHSVGYARDMFVKTANWNPENFEVDEASRTIRLIVPLRGRTHTQACDTAMADFCEENVHICPAGFKPWLAGRAFYHPVIGMTGSLANLKVPTPTRGIFGIATAGVHVNAFTPKLDPSGSGKPMIRNGKPVIDIIWLSKRSATTTFPNSYDQIIAGAVDTEDEMDAFAAFAREADEEANIQLDKASKTALFNGAKCGDFTESDVLAFYTLKGEIAGAREDGHLEPAMRFVFDLMLKPGFTPTVACEEAESFHAIKVEDIQKEAFKADWKYSSGVVFAEFLWRHGLLDFLGEEFSKEIIRRSRHDLPLQDVKRYLKFSKDV